MQKPTLAKIFLVAAAFAVCGVSAQAQSERQKESFDANWRFARFGLQADGSRKPEPGATNFRFSLTASSEESGHVAGDAMDNNPDTRWCANGAGAKQWLAIDLGGEFNVSRAEVQWEFPDLKYGFVVERSADGKTWAPLPGAAREIRIRTTALPDAKWASIREVKLFDAAGQEIRNTLQENGALTPSAVAFNDSGWRALSVPHDWGIEGPFRYDLDGNTGKLPWQGIGWYRKHFTVPAGDAGKRVIVAFDGAMANAQVWLNGQYVGTWPYGYQGFQFDLTDKIKFGGENVLAVRLDTELWGSRWYPGAGIYRNVWLIKTAPVHVGQWGVFVTTPKISTTSGEADLAVTVDNQGGAAAKASVQTAVYELGSDDAAGAKVAESAAAETEIAANSSATVNITAAVPQPKLWDVDAPNRYLARTTVSVDGRTTDVYDTPFGFRMIEFTHDHGFLLNGRRVEINGTCNHSDLGALGMAFNTSAMKREMEILRDMGCNALRTSHNPPAPEFLQLADKMGFLVMCEAFDCWEHGKTPNDYSRLYPAWHKKDLEAMVRHFRNHPSIILWSTGNEIAEQNGPKYQKELRGIIAAEDPTRPVSAGCNNPNAGVDGFQTAVDAFGLNYHTGQYGRLFDFPANKNLPFYGSETSSQISSRGEYFFGAQQQDFQMSSYDLQAVPWGCTPDVEFAALAQHPGFAGEFVWTGFDYLGEPTPYNSDASNLLNFSDPAERAKMEKELEALGKIRVPSRSSYFGIVDLAGFPKDRYYLYQAHWRPNLPMAHLVPQNWNWPARVGQVTPVFVYTSGDSAELFLNGHSLGKKTFGKLEYRLRWDDVKYAPGTLKVVAYKDGKEWATDVVKTTGTPVRLALSADRSAIADDGLDLAYVTVRVNDANGLMVPTANNEIKFSVAGPGEIVATDNGDATSFVPFQSHDRPAFNGLVLVIVRSKPGESGAITVRAASAGLAAASVTVRAQ